MTTVVGIGIGSGSCCCRRRRRVGTFRARATPCLHPSFTESSAPSPKKVRNPAGNEWNLQFINNMRTLNTTKCTTTTNCYGWNLRYCWAKGMNSLCNTCGGRQKLMVWVGFHWLIFTQNWFGLGDEKHMMLMDVMCVGESLVK
jgi:hypothetical protein